jgi:hypothetical protein
MGCASRGRPSWARACARLSGRAGAQAFLVMEEMAQIRQAMWFKGRYRSDAVSAGLLLAAAVQGGRLDQLPRVLMLLVRPGIS